MSAPWLSTSLPGVLRRTLVAHQDARGSFTELWRATWTEGLATTPFVQANLSRSSVGVLRGMHFHRRQTDLWLLVEGRAFVASVDLRAGAREGPVASETFEMAPGEAVVIPPMVAHGFYAIDPIALIYLVTVEYDGSDEHGFAWDDPRAAIQWPSLEPILSERDASNPPLSSALG